MRNLKWSLLLLAALAVGCGEPAAPPAKAKGDAETSEARPPESPPDTEPEKSPAEDAVAQPTLRDQYRELESEFVAAVAEFNERWQTADLETQQNMLAEYPGLAFGKRLLDFAAEHEGTPEAEEAVVLAAREGSGEVVITALSQLSKTSPDAISGLIVNRIRTAPDLRVAQWLDTVIEGAQSEDMKAYALFAKSKLYEGLKQVFEQMDASQIDQRFGGAAPYLRSMADTDFDRELTDLLERIERDHADVPIQGRKLGELVSDMLFVIKNLAIGAMAMEIEAADLDGESFKLSDYRGKVVMLDFWGDW